MTTQNPRDQRDWMRSVERRLTEARNGTASVAGNLIEVVTDTNTRRDLTPAAPVEITYQAGLYVGPAGRARARVIVDFPDVVKATNATDITVTSYELWGYDVTYPANRSAAYPTLFAPGVAFPGAPAAATTPSVAQLLGTSSTSAFRTDGFTPGSVWVFKVRALVAAYPTPGLFSTEFTVQMLADSTPPPQPTAPVLTVERGVITVEWDGQSVGGDMPADFKYAILATGDASSPTTEVMRWGRDGGIWVATGLPYYKTQFFRVQAVDESGNRGPWSVQATGYTTPLVDTDIILSTIDGAKTLLTNIDAGVSILAGTVLTRHLVVTEEMTAAIANFLTVNVGMLNANSIWADAAWFGLADAKLVRSDMFTGKAFVGGTFTGSVFQTTDVEYSGVQFDAAGLVGYAATGGVETFRLSSADGSLTASAGTLTGLKYQTHLAANTGIKIDTTNGFKFWDTSNRLVVDISGSAATFTGKITSGFGAVKAVLGDNIFGSRPGVQFVTGAGYTWEPFMTSFGLSADGAQRGTLYLSAAWTSGTAEPGRLSMSLDAFNLASYHGGVFTQADTLKAYGGSGNNNYFQAGPASTFMANSGGSISVDSNGTGYIYAPGGTTISGGLQVSGSKNFVMDHPTRPGMELLHGATESPVSGVEYWGGGVVGADGSGAFALPEYFTALTKPGTARIFVYGNGAVVGWGGVVNNTVTVTGPSGTAFTWLVKAERTGGDFDVERSKVVWSGPDTGA